MAAFLCLHYPSSNNRKTEFGIFRNDSVLFVSAFLFNANHRNGIPTQSNGCTVARVYAMKEVTRPTSDSVERFCKRHGISLATFYRRRDRMPRAIKIGGQLRILDTDETAWIQARQAEAAQGRAA